MDDTFGTNKYKFHLTTVMVIGKYGTGIPVAWILHKYDDGAVFRNALNGLAKMMGGSEDVATCLAAFCPKYIVIDACAKETNGIKECMWSAGNAAVRGDVPAIKIMYCLWHVKRAWKKHMLKHCKNEAHRSAMMEELNALLCVTVRRHTRVHRAASTLMRPRLRRTPPRARALPCGVSSTSLRMCGARARPSLCRICGTIGSAAWRRSWAAPRAPNASKLLRRAWCLRVSAACLALPRTSSRTTRT